MINTEFYKYWFMESILDDSGKYAYFSMVNSDELCKLDMFNHSVSIIGKVPGVKPINQMYRGGLYQNKKIYFPPRKTDKMAVLNIDTSRIHSVDILKDYIGQERSILKSSCQGYLSIKDSKGNGWFIHRNSPMCVKIDKDDDHLSYITCEDTGKECILGTEYLIVDDVAYVPVKMKSQILKLDMGEETIGLLNIGKGGELFYSIANDNRKEFFLLSYSKPGIVKWDPIQNKIDRIVDLPIDKIEYGNEYVLRCMSNGFAVFPGLDISGNTNFCFRVDKDLMKVVDTSTFSPYIDYTKYLMQADECSFCYFVTLKREDIFLTKYGKCIKYNFLEDIITEWELPVPMGETIEERSKIIEKYERSARYRYCYDNSDIHVEDDYLGLEAFIVGLENDKV